MAQLNLNGVSLVADVAGALLWPERRLLAVADLHLEKGSSYARRGHLLPPYDTGATLRRLESVIARTAPETVICLGDSFHDAAAPERMDSADIAHLRRLTGGSDWVWITGNHDPDPPAGMGGRAAAELRLGALVFRHEARPGARGEVSGHHHPVAALRIRGRRLRVRCFAQSAERLILPAFGAYTGGLNVLDPAFGPLLGTRFSAHLLGSERIFSLPPARLEPDPRNAFRLGPALGGTPADRRDTP